MRIEGGGPYKALLVPDEAVGTDQNEQYLMMVDGTGTVQTKPRATRPAVGEMRVIDDGITAADRVIVNGLQMAQAGAKVNASMAPRPREARLRRAATTGSGS